MRVAVVGAGPAGMSAAIAAAQAGARVDLFDHNEKIGKKLFITGKGRCNLTNDAPIEDFFENVITNRRFLYSALYSFDNYTLKNMIEGAGCPLKTERGGRVFPKSDKSSDILKAFERLLAREGVKVHLNAHCQRLLIENGAVTGIRVNGEDVECDAAILCSGGYSYRQTGSDGSGYKLAAGAGHTLKPPEPALVGLEVKEDWPKEISGLTLKNVGVRLYKGSKLLFEEQGECLLTHTGVSGPVVLSASSFVKPPYDDYSLLIDLKPGLSPERLDERLQRDFAKYSNKDFLNALGDLLPKSLIPAVIAASGIPPRAKVNGITRLQRQRLGQVLKGMRLSIASPGPMEAAIVTRGGVEVGEVDPGTMESKIVRGLYFAGEVLDVDALTGGYNIQIACSTGYLAGVSAAGDGR